VQKATFLIPIIVEHIFGGFSGNIDIFAFPGELAQGG
jgi:hypothetical protein